MCFVVASFHLCFCCVFVVKLHWPQIAEDLLRRESRRLPLAKLLQDPSWAPILRDTTLWRAIRGSLMLSDALQEVIEHSSSSQSVTTFATVAPHASGNESAAAVALAASFSPK